MSEVSLDVTDGIALITIDNPPVNALSQRVREGLTECIERADSDSDCEAIVIACRGRTFIAGADIREFDQPPAGPLLPNVVERIEAVGKPVVAALHGTALGGGLEVALGCHYRIAAASAKVGLPEVNLGLLPGATGTQRVPRLAGAQAALDLMLSGKPLPSDAAHEIGIVDRVVADDALLDAAIEYAKELRTRGPRRIRDLPVPPAAEGLFDEVRKKIASKTRGLLSPEKIIQCVEAATTHDYEAGCRFERECFLECKASPQSAGLRHAFFAERAAARVPGIGKDTPTRDIARVAVLGAGTMGAGIAYACMSAGLDVHLLDNSEEGLAHGRDTISGYLQHGIQRGKLTETTAALAMDRLSTSTSYDDVADADLVIEAVFENMAVKKEVFATLDRVCRAGAILATNTSTLDVDEIASATSRARDVVGLHFFSPAHIMRLLEIVRGAETGDDVVATALAFAKRLRKVGVVVGNCFGFVGNRMLYSYGRENQFLLLEGAAPEFIDRTLFDWGMAMGPNAVGDLAGLDVGYKVRQERSDLPEDPRFYRVADMLAEQGRFGQKTGRGMYLYEAGSRSPQPDPDVQTMIRAEAERLGVTQRDISADEVIDRCIFGLVTEGARILEDGIASRASDIDVIWIAGYGFPAWRGGPMHFADELGLDAVYRKVLEFRERFGAEFWEPPGLLKSLAESGGRFSDVGT